MLFIIVISISLVFSPVGLRQFDRYDFYEKKFLNFIFFELAN